MDGHTNKQPAGCIAARRENVKSVSGAAWLVLFALLIPAAAHGQTVTTYSYDPLQRLTGATTGGSSIQYTYDPDGNLTSITRASSTSLSPNQPLDVNLNVPGQSASFTFSVTDSGSAEVSLSSISTSPSGSSVTVAVYNSSGTLVSTTTGTADATLSLSGLPAGAYTVVLTPPSSGTASLQVDLAVAAEPDMGGAPLPVWTYALLAAGLLGTLVRVQRRSRGLASAPLGMPSRKKPQSWLKLGITALVSAISFLASGTSARASCSQPPSPPTYHCTGGLCASSCPDGSLSALRACAEAVYDAELEQDFGPLTFLYNRGTFTNPDYWYSSVGNGDYDASMHLVSAGQDCPQTERNLGHKGCPANGGPMMGNPINVSTGNKYQEEMDYQGPGDFPLSFLRYYNSGGGGDGSVGARWSHTLSRILLLQSSTEVKLLRDDGEVLYFEQCGSSWCPDSDEIGTLTEQTNPSGYVTGWTYVGQDDVAEVYDGGGRLLSVTSRAGLKDTLAYDGEGRLSTVSDPFGHVLTLTYDSSNRMSQLKEPDGDVVGYSYDSSGNLSTVTYPDNTTRTYLYNESGLVGTGAAANLLTGIEDESGQRFATFAYDGESRAIESEHAGGADEEQITYNSDGSATVVDALAASRNYSFDTVQSVNYISSVSGPVCTSCSLSASYSYDPGGDLSSETDFDGNQTDYSYDVTRHLETSRTEASGSSVARTITTQWSPTYRLPTLISTYAGSSASGTPLRTTSLGYDTSGNLLTKTVTDPGTGASRTWTYTYDSYGRTLTAKDPRTDVNDTTTYTYYSCTTGSQCGELETATDALGHVTTYNSYDGGGRPLTITDANGVVSAVSYDTRGRVISQSVGGETTSFSYYPTGLLEQVTLPDGSSLSYAYDAAHRLIQVSDGLGDEVAYVLDALGNRVAVNSYDPSRTLFRTHTRVISQLDEVYQEINAAGTPAVTTTFGYDNNGNQTSIAAPLDENTTESYDALNRLDQIKDPAGGITSFGYDAEDDLTSVDDPRTLVTSYSYNGFGDLISKVSPDTGATTNTYDSAGNLFTSTDARGAVATYGYDALNRVTSIAYSLSGSADQTLSFTYDQGTDGIGHLTGASDANHSLSWTYGVLGEVTSQTQTVAGLAKTIQYGYSNGDLTSLTTPSGQAIGYQYSNHRITAITINGGPVVSDVTYAPFGPVTAWQWGNGTSVSRTYDGDGQVTSSTTGGYTASYSYYADGTLEGVTENAPAVYSTSSGSTSLSIANASNEIASLSGATSGSYQYDAAGDVLSDGTRTFTYDDAGRLATATTGGGITTTYRYNALGERIEKSNSSGTIYFVYDEAGHLLGEYDASGNLIEELVWLNDTPVASLRPNPSGSGIEILYIATDYLNAPTELVRATDSKVMWRWDHDPYGNGAALEDPSNTGTDTVFNLRLPGQYYDPETGLMHNGFRDYDPTVGRYVESDPTGLAGGSYSTYAYVGGDPIDNVDPFGLFDWPSLPGWIYDPAVGIADAASLGIGPLLRQEYGIGGPDTCSSGYAVGQAAGIIGGFATGEGEVQLAERLLTAEGTLRTTETVAQQLAGARSFIPVQSILDAVASGTRVPDPQGVAGYFLYTAGASYNSSVGTLEVLVDEENSIIAHVLYRSGQ